MQFSKSFRKLRGTRLVGLVMVLLAGVIVGCGGGGGGGSTTSSTTTTTSTTSGAGLPVNTVVYGLPNGTDNNFDVKDIKPDGTNNQTLVANVSGQIVLFTVNPAVANQYIAAADLNGNGFFGLYKTVGLTLTGAVQLVAPELTYISSIAVTMDGSKVIFTAVDTTDTSYLYTIPTAGGVAVKLANANGATISPADSDTIAYVTAPAGEDFDQVFTRSLAAGAGGVATKLTTNALNHTLPAFSRDGHHLAWWEMSDTTNTLIVLNRTTSATVALPNPDNLFPQASAFNGSGTSIVYAGANDAGAGSLLTQLADGSANPVTIFGATDLVGNYGVYWSDANGRLIGGSTGMSSVGRRKLRDSQPKM